MMFFVPLILAVCSVVQVEGQNNDSRRELTAAPRDESKRKSVKIVAYNPIKGYLNWIHPWFIQYGKQNCSLRCELSLDSSQTSTADIVLFLASTMDKSFPVLPAGTKRKDTVYALMSMEQPKYAPILAQKDYLQKHFQLMMTYSLSQAYSDTGIPNLPMTYYPLNIVAKEAIMQPARPFQDKIGVGGVGQDALVAVFASNCKNAGASDRSKYLEEFIGLVPTHSFGKCFHNMDEPPMKADPNWPEIAQRRARKVKVLSRYKFYLAFENAPIPDYVSEKVFEGLIAGSVPIYRGTDAISKFLPAGSYINANGLKPAALAELVIKLASNEEEYNKYFAFKHLPIAPHFIDMASMSYSHPNALCRMCEYYADKYPQ